MFQSLIRIFRLLATYFLGQGLTQFLQLLTGFIIIRALSKDDYAVFTLIMAVSATANVLVQFGAGQALTGLLGSVRDDLDQVGRYLRAARFYRARIVAAAVLVLCLVIILYSEKLELGGYVTLFVWLCLSLSVFYRTEVAIHRPALLVHRELRAIYIVGVSGGIARLACIGLAYYFEAFTFEWAILLVALQTAFEGISIRRLSMARARLPESKVDIESEKLALKKQTLPRAPGYAFYAFEGQITIFILSFLGTTASLAELGALSRIGLLFVIFNMMGSMLIAPYFSTLERAKVYGFSFLFIIGSAAFFTAFAWAVYVFPQPFLWLLGTGYENLEFEVFLVVVAAGIKTFGSLIFSICTARKYIASWYPFVDVAPVIVAMVVFFSIFDLSELIGVLYYGTAIAVVRLLSKIFVFVNGLRSEKAAMPA